MSASTIRFSAARLFYGVSLCATSTALFGVLGLPIAAFVILIWWQILSGAQRESNRLHRKRMIPLPVPLRSAPPQNCIENRGLQDRVSPLRKGAFKLELVVVLLISAILLGLLLPASNDSDPMLHAESSMRVVAEAIASYEERHGRPLPAVIVDEHGNPMHSWRALILAELGEQKLAAAYRLDEPWNSPHNLELAQYRPWHYRRFDLDSQRWNDGACRQETSLQLVRLDGDFLLAEQEQMVGNWLKPMSLPTQKWNESNLVPTLDQGFWHHGFFTSQYRGRLLVGDDRSFNIHPGEPLAAPLTPASSATEVIGKPFRQYHFQNALRLAAFLMVALYPIRWLPKTEDETTVAN